MLKTFLIIPLVLIFSINAYATTYTFTGSGVWSDILNWDTYPPNPVPQGDIVNINGDCTLDLTIQIDGDIHLNDTMTIDEELVAITIYNNEYLIINANMSFTEVTGSGDITIGALGSLFGTYLSTTFLVNYGSIDIDILSPANQFQNFGTANINSSNVDFVNLAVGSTFTTDNILADSIYINGYLEIQTTSGMFNYAQIDSFGIFESLNAEINGQVDNLGTMNSLDFKGTLNNSNIGIADIDCNSCGITNSGNIVLTGQSANHITNLPVGIMDFSVANFIDLYNEGTLKINGACIGTSITDFNGILNLESAFIEIQDLYLTSSLLMGDGDIISSMITIDTSNTISPGSSPGNLTIQTINPSVVESQINFEIFNFDESDYVDFSGPNITLNSKYNVSFQNGFVPYIGQEIVLFDDYNEIINPASSPTLNLPNGYTYSQNLFQYDNQLSFTVLTDESTGKVGLNTIDPKSALHIGQGDLFFSQEGGGIIIKDLDGQCYKTFIGEVGEIGSGELGLRLSPIACPDN